MHIQEELTDDLVTASTAVDNNNGIDKPNSAATIVEHQVVVEPDQDNMTNINNTPQSTERISVPVQVTNTTNINCTPHPTEGISVLVQANMFIVNCTPHTTVRQQSVNPKYLNKINIGKGQTLDEQIQHINILQQNIQKNAKIDKTLQQLNHHLRTPGPEPTITPSNNTIQIYYQQATVQPQ